MRAILRAWNEAGHWLLRRWGGTLLFRLWVKGHILLRTNSLWLALGYGRTDYEVLEIEDFLAPAECDALVARARAAGLTQSTISSPAGQYVVDASVRQSQQAWLDAATDELAAEVARRVQHYVPLPLEHQEDLQVVRYGPDEFYRRHYDTPYQNEVIRRFNRYCGPRVATLLVYLNDDFEGGETDFVLANKTVVPKKGKAILFYNADINLTLIPESLHVGRRVRRGEKWIANKWIRVFPFRPSSAVRIAQHGDVPWMMRIEK